MPDAIDEVSDVLPQIKNLHALYKAMAGQRRRRGAIDFETPEVKFRLDQRGEVESMGATERNDAHKLIEECMIAANVQAALFLEKKKIPALFRAHEPPPAEKYEDLQQFLREFKLSMPPIDRVTPGDFAEVLRMVHDRPERELIQSVLLRSQSMAAYQPENRGHFGLALSAYAHFTSPIRRYPDLLVHRAIRYALTGGKPDKYSYTPAEMGSLAVHCSQRERRAEEAERDVDERFKCAWMSKHVGSEFDGVVTGVTSFGLFVELDESKVSGLVHISQLANDYYHFDPIRKLLKGEKSGEQFRLGDHVRVQVLRASLEDRKIDFRLVPQKKKGVPPPRTAKAYDYAASGERYSLPKTAAALAPQGARRGRACSVARPRRSAARSAARMRWCRSAPRQAIIRRRVRMRPARRHRVRRAARVRRRRRRARARPRRRRRVRRPPASPSGRGGARRQASAPPSAGGGKRGGRSSKPKGKS